MKNLVIYKPRLIFCLNYSTAPDWQARGQFGTQDRAPQLRISLVFFDLWIRLPWFHYERAAFREGCTGISSYQRTWSIYWRGRYGHVTWSDRMWRFG